MDNQITVTGNLTRDPELRFTPSGQPNARLGIAVNRRWMDRTTSEWQEETSFFNVVAWGTLAENVNESLVRGDRILVNGQMQQRSYEDTDGAKKQVFEIRADEVAPSLRWATASVTKNSRKPQPAAVAAGNGEAAEGEEPF